MILVLALAVASTPAAPLDGGPPPPEIVERIEGSIPATPTAAAPRPESVPKKSAAPAPAASALPRAVPIAAPAPTPSPKPTRAKVVPTAAPILVPAAAPRPPAARGAFGVHISSFRRRATAEADAKRLAALLSLPARVLEVNLGSKGVWYRVVVGELGTGAEASALCERLKKTGIADAEVQGLREQKSVP